MSAFTGLRPCKCGETPTLCNESGRVYFECACKSVKAKPVWQSRGAADKARENWNRSVG
jgi:hypothetical protein